jgi:hypothetical protein
MVERDTAAPRKPYSPPRLVSYGHVKDLVQGGTGMMNDGLGHPSKNCWIAEVLYGIDDARTLLLRSSLTIVYNERRPGWIFVALYRRFGRATAALIHRGVLPRWAFRPLFDMLLGRALADAAHAVRTPRR